jgi:hypothetical protein
MSNEYDIELPSGWKLPDRCLAYTALVGMLAAALVAVGSSTAQALVESKCVTSKGEREGRFEYFFDAQITERQRPCRKDQTEVLTRVFDAIAGEKAKAGLLPEGFTGSILVEGTTENTTVLERFPDHPVLHEPSGTLVTSDVTLDITEGSEYGEDIPDGCALWFGFRDQFTPENPAFSSLTSRPVFTNFFDHSGDLTQATDVWYIMLVGPAPLGQARLELGPTYIELPDGTRFRFDDAEVRFIDECEGSVRVTVE